MTRRQAQPRQRGRVAARPPVRVLGGVALTVLLLSGSACSATSGVTQSPKIPAKYANRETGTARLLADVTGRIVGIVNVTDDYPDPDRTVLGATVLLDRTVGHRAARADFRRRPVLVVYTDARAAKQAVHGRQHSTYLLYGSRVIYLPPDFPAAARRTYQQGLSVGLQ